MNIWKHLLRIEYLAYALLLSTVSCQNVSDNSLHRISIEDTEIQGHDIELIQYDSSAFPYRPKARREPQGLLMKYAGREIYHYPTEKVDAVLFFSGLAVDADGAPKAYHPQDIGLDALEHAGTEGNWWALATDNDMPSGTPVIQSENDPAPGYYVSMTSLSSPYMPATNQKKYVDASTIPYFVLPGTVRARTKMSLGDIGLVFNRKNQQFTYAIFADTGPEWKLGEGSIALAKALGVNDNPRTGGIASDIIYLLFPRSGDGLPKDLKELQALGNKYFKKWGGMKEFQKRIAPPVLAAKQD